MNVKEFLTTVRLYWKTFAAFSLTMLALGIAWMILSPMQYVSTAQLLVTVNGSTTANAYQNDDVVTSRVSSYVALLGSDVVSQRVVDKLQLPLSARELSAKVSAVNIPNTAVIDVAVTDSSPDAARRIADAAATEFVSYTAALESPTGEDAQKVQTEVVSSASQPRSRLAERIGIGALIFLGASLIGLAAVWIRSLTDPVVRTARQASAAARAPLLASVTDRAADSTDTLEPWRQLKAALKPFDCNVLQLSPVDEKVNTMTVARNLERVLQLADVHCIVIDARPESHPEFGHPEFGHRGEKPEEETSEPETSNSISRDPEIALLTSTSANVRQLRRGNSQLMIVTGPVQPRHIASMMSEESSAVLLLVAVGKTDKNSVIRAAQRLRAVSAPVIGAVLIS